MSFVMSQVFLNGIPYIRSRDAARLVGLAPDYVSRLARAGVIQGHRLNRLWLVNLASLQAFVADQARQKAVLRAKLAQMRREEQRLAGHPSALRAALT
jgi:excisionase family DNA binding protein